MNEKLIKILKTNQYSLTSARVVVFEAFLTENNPITMRELVAKLSNVIDRASIYRSVAIFEQIGVLSRIQIGWKHKLELSDIFQHHHHHIRCTKCGTIETFHETEQLLSELDNIANAKLFKLKSHTLELSGLCSECSKH